jgi:uncharacterized integral membrane protein
MEEHEHLPDTNQLSVLISTILLAYAVSPFIKIPDAGIQIQLPFGTFSFPINFLTIVSFIVALLAGLGMDTILRKHPHFSGGSTVQHAMLPALTAWAIGFPLGSLTFQLGWWVLFILGGILLVLVFIAEYIVMDFSDVRFALSSIGLTALSFALFLILGIALRSSGARLYLMVPTLAIPLALVSLRTLYLRLNGHWYLAWAAGIVVLVMQLAIALQYLPVSPVSYGLILVGGAYGVTTLAGYLEEGRTWRSALIEPGIVTLFLVVIALVIG